jgi:eukaryotic-like serine/threonine-protein kinase
MHGLTHWFASGDKAYALGWVTRDFEWGTVKGVYNLVMSSFYGDKPTGARARPKVS